MASTTRYSIVLPLFAGGRGRRHPGAGAGAAVRARHMHPGFRAARGRGPVTPSVSHRISGRRSLSRTATPARTKIPTPGPDPNPVRQGYVWREAFNGDTICVTPAFRQQMFDANGAAASRKQTSQPAPAAPPAQNPLCAFQLPITGMTIPCLESCRGPGIGIRRHCRHCAGTAVAQPDTCISGFVWREARNGDTVCVTPDMRATIAQQNSTPGPATARRRVRGLQSLLAGLRLAGGVQRRHHLRDTRFPRPGAGGQRRGRITGGRQRGPTAGIRAVASVLDAVRGRHGVLDRPGSVRSCPRGHHCAVPPDHGNRPGEIAAPGRRRHQVR